MKSFLFRLFLLFFALASFARADATAVSQQTMLGQLDSAIKDRNALVSGDDGFVANANNWTNTGGGPRLSAIGIQLASLMGPKSALSWLLASIMVVTMRTQILRAMHAGDNVPRVMASMALKLMMGVFVCNFPQYFYAMGMMVRDSTVLLMRSAYGIPAVASAMAQQAVSASPTNLDFEAIRIEAIRRAIKDNHGTMIGNASDVTYDLYDQFVQLTSGGANAQLTARPITGDASKIEKTRLLTDNMPLLIEAMSRTDPSQQTINWKLKRVGINGRTEVMPYGSSTSINTSTADGMNALDTTTMPASQVSATSASLTNWLRGAELIRKKFQTQADSDGYASPDAYTSAEQLAKTQYDSMVYTETTNFIHQTFWDEVAFAGGRKGGAVKDWQYPSSWTTDQQNALSYQADKLGEWWDQSTGRMGGSYSSATPSDQDELGWSRTIVNFMGKIRDYLVSKGGFWFFDVVIEAYVFILFLAFPFWFYPKTARAFTGALNTFFVTCITPAALTLVYLVWDAFMTKMLHLITGGVFDLAYAWLGSLS